MEKKIGLDEALLVGLGVAAMAKEQAEDFLNFLRKEGRLASKDQAKLRKQLVARGEKEYRAMTKGYGAAVKRTFEILNVPTRSEFEALKRKVEKKKS